MVDDAISNNNLQHLMFYGSAGTGKTTLCRAIANDLGADLLYLNCSLDSSIDNIRSSVVSFSSSVSLSGGNKIVLLDEAEGMSAQAQNALKGVVEEFSNTRFFFTTNSVSKMIDPLKSRCLVIDFSVTSAEKPKLAAAMFKRVLGILEKEKIAYDKKVVAEVVNKFFPDFRRTLNEIQRYAASGTIDSGILIENTAATYDDLIAALKAKDFKKVRSWVSENADADSSQLFREFYDNAYVHFEPQCIPSVILILADYGYKSTAAVDQTINLMAALIEIMISAVFKEA
jgi:replication factor C small subunit